MTILQLVSGDFMRAAADLVHLSLPWDAVNAGSPADDSDRTLHADRRGSKR